MDQRGRLLPVNQYLDILPDNGNIEAITMPKLAREGSLKVTKYDNVNWRSIDTYKDIEEAEKQFEKLIPKQKLRRKTIKKRPNPKSRRIMSQQIQRRGLRPLLSMVRPANSVMVGFAVIVGMAVTSNNYHTIFTVTSLLGFLTGFFISSFSMVSNDIYESRSR